MFGNTQSAASALLGGLERHHRARGLNYSQLLKDHNLEAYGGPGKPARISLRNFSRLLRAAGQRNGDPRIGENCANDFDLGDTGSFGLAMLNAPTLGDMLRHLVSFAPLIITYCVMTLEIVEDEACLAWSFGPHLLSQDELTEFMFFLGVRHTRSYLGANWVPQNLCLSSRNKLNVETSNSASPCYRNEIRIPVENLAVQKLQADDRVFTAMQRLCEKDLHDLKNATPLIQKIRHDVLCSIGSAQMNLAELAAMHDMSPRRMQRTLSRFDTNYATLIDQCRGEISSHLLEDSNLPVQVISERLGYASPASYARAAAEWYRCTPGEWRDNYRKTRNTSQIAHTGT
jgi:AraC-like DNA-binding protein